ncbi:MAG TPA: 23S rRNA (adenine(2030)-N(6))-methyltransferase RlmJ [Paracoccaceae bacterium]|nr:23S rRNA (adenine(2030)-N(6))-methyltransferase RlmJ [Paracoccaceae bacterium]
MLSYQHGYHAGNMADVHKHALLAWMLRYLTQKDKPLSYLETHAGRGLYRLDAPEALKTGEAAAGIERVEELGWFGAEHPYSAALAKVRSEHGAAAYPGSPLVAQAFMRAEDRMTLAELHPQEHAALAEVLGGRAQVLKEDGAKMALRMVPPEPKRGLLLIDPSYEIKGDYEAAAKLVRQVHGRWSVGVIVLWYPILTSGLHRTMAVTLERALPDAVRHEVRFPPAREGHRMVGSGLFVVNPPYGFSAEAARLSRLFDGLAPFSG